MKKVPLTLGVLAAMGGCAAMDAPPALTEAPEAPGTVPDTGAGSTMPETPIDGGEATDGRSERAPRPADPPARDGGADAFDADGEAPVASMDAAPPDAGSWRGAAPFERT